ncbi:alpha/beta hydrolase [Streptomyces subrutilus]|uniref:DUF676 domain-containing protein n=1 Tax=Streptomyces subrutilus TaxID=36818 RepID=A0A5P2UZM8_9ACTN|nr:alpha/beta hydrolase [Streptomyces subrutilus]QEU82227.1 hypothetical protein CP968_31685 [Streptomyces subrutilus]WSJ28290.1 alpha/beta hydrolase [Streptomyces subrutilus]GGZ95568.1 hypothetical protein GCM10010371_64500 [Streptomyces subrutilus]
MSDPSELQTASALAAAPPVVLAAGPRELPAEAPPKPDAEWQLPHGTAWVYLANSKHGLVKPIILADGFNSGPSTLEFSWAGLETRNHPLISSLRRAGRDVILLGFTERSASILVNAQAAVAAIRRAIAERLGDEPLVVGGFSMGGLVTRYALAKLETERMDHQTALYFSWDSPHRGAYIPLALQAFAHYIRKLDPRFSDQMNSPAARQLLRWHIETWEDAPAVSQERTDFLAALESVGSWPLRPRKIALANGVGTGVGNGIDAGETAVEGRGLGITGTDLRTQPTGTESLVATLRVITSQKAEVHAPGLPAVDGAPGGTLDGFGILADTLNGIIGLGVNDPIRSHCFVPSVSAVGVRDIDTQADLYVSVDDLPPEESEFDEFVLATENEEHTKITAELSTWLIERLP